MSYPVCLSNIYLTIYSFSLAAIEMTEPTSSDTSTKPSIKIGVDGYPILPILDDESITPKLVRDLLKDFISAIWGASQSLLIYSYM